MILYCSCKRVAPVSDVQNDVEPFVGDRRTYLTQGLGLHRHQGSDIFTREVTAESEKSSRVYIYRDTRTKGMSQTNM